MVNSFCRTNECTTQTVYSELASRYLNVAEVPSKQRILTAWNAYVALHYNEKKDKCEFGFMIYFPSHSIALVDRAGSEENVIAALAKDYAQACKKSKNIEELSQDWILRALNSGATGINPSTSARSVRKSVESVADGFNALVSPLLSHKLSLWLNLDFRF
jgi:hypothetical protein